MQSPPRLPLILLLGMLAAGWAIPLGLLGPGAPAVTGRVLDEAGPVAGACVRFQGAARAVVTDASGRFRLPGPPAAGARVAAAKEGYPIVAGPANRPRLTLRLSRLPAADFEEYAWVDPAPDRSAVHNCGNCHDAIYREWSSSGHARSATNRRFRNLYDGSDWRGRPGVGWSLLGENPDAAGVCTACHAPTVPAFTDPAYTDLRQVRGVAARGVHCDYCHKVADVHQVPDDPEEGIGRLHGRFGLKLLRPAEGQLFFGPLADAERAGEAFAFTPLYRQSRYCASCHEGTVLGVHVYGTYSEWLESPARHNGQECQTCHQAPTGRLSNVAPGKGGLERDPWTLSNHVFFAGSLADMLRRCLKVSAVLTRSPPGLRVAVEVRAEEVGHRVPTGFVDRNVVLVVEGLDRDGQPVPLGEGPTLPAFVGRGTAGLPGKLYAKVLADFDGRRPAPFWRADPDAIDTRLRPGGSDQSVFLFPTEVERVRLRLLYRRFWQVVADEKGWPDNEITVVDQTFAAPGES